ncbi:hypothetical protein DERP_000661 [Dermatophagoides pteronyssinus]|uniref:Uncharacterized protein n=1 Tax=Dermatophagoides pteronyssinus TaxID=6956 RepID=A0ABQ8J0U4_DERPT|nr:hypothetical protein DERP_000661 [Dermatophagoides pteronyssinus]
MFQDAYIQFEFEFFFLFDHHHHYRLSDVKIILPEKKILLVEEKLNKKNLKTTGSYGHDDEDDITSRDSNQTRI